MAFAVAVRFLDEMEVEEEDAEAAARSRRAMVRYTRGAKAVAKIFLEGIAGLFLPFRRKRRRRSTLAWTRTTRSGARSLLVDSVACALAVRVVDEVGVEVEDAEAADRSRRAVERCTRGARAVAKLFLKGIAGLFLPPRREKRQRNTLAWTRTTRRGARS